jgi:hypothetical protein
VTIKGYFWRSSVQSTIKTILEQRWAPEDHTRVAMVIPGGVSVLRENKAPDVSDRNQYIHLSVVEREEYERDTSKLVAITTRVCIGLMRQGYEVRNDTEAMRRTGLIGASGPVDEVKLIGDVEEFKREFGDPTKNGGPKK